MPMKAIVGALSALCVFLAAAATMPAAAQTDQWNALYDRIIRIEHELKSMRGVGQQGQQPAGDATYRLAAVEEQMRQLMGQVQEMSARMRDMQAQIQAMGGRKSGSLQEPSPFQQQLAQAPQPDYTLEHSTESLQQYQTQELAELSARTDGEVIYDAPQQPELAPSMLGQMSVEQSQTNTLVAPRSVEGVESSLLPETVETASLDGGQISGSADGLYEQAYDNLLGRRFGAAEAGFKTFLSRHADDPLAGDAQYWLGETYFVQGDFKEAAQSFLKGYKSYPRNRKAPDSLFKLAQSLDKLGQKPQACGAYAELTKQYPKAANLRNQALKEMQRSGC